MRRSVIAAVVVAVAATALGSSSSSREGYSGMTEAITIGYPSSIGITTYTDIAQEQQFFTKNGLSVTMVITRKG